MPPELGRTWTLEIEGVPPHMSGEDYLIWIHWRRTIRERPTAVYFDVGLGDGRPPPADAPANLKAMWLRLNQKRADVVLEYPDRWILVELRHHANANALGRLLMYRMLWTADPPDARPLHLALVSDTLDPDLVTATQLHEIDYFYPTEPPRG